MESEIKSSYLLGKDFRIVYFHEADMSFLFLDLKTQANNI